MFEFLLNNILYLTFIALISASVFFALVYSSSIGWADPLLLNALLFGFVVSMLEAVRIFFGESHWTRIYQLSYFVFFFSIFITNLVLKSLFGGINNHIDNIRTNLNGEKLSKDNKLFIIFLVAAVIAIIANSIFSLKMMESQYVGDARLILRQDNRFIDLAKRDFLSISIFLAGILFIGCDKTRKKILIIMMLLIVVSALFCGSKAFLLSVILIYYFGFHFVIKKFNIRLIHIGILGAGLLSVGAAKMIWGFEDTNIFTTIFYRLFWTGDAYFYSPGLIDQSSLYGTYDALNYLLHPIYRLFQSSGYDHPLGVELSGILTGEYIGTGPNAVFPLLVGVLSNGSVFIICYAMFFIGSFTVFCRYIGVAAFNSTWNRYPVIAVCILFSTFSLPIVILIDIGIFQQLVIGNIFVVVCLQLVAVLSGKVI